MKHWSVGFVYVLTNDAMPNMVKVGSTKNLSEDRARQLRTTGVPLPFAVEYRQLTSHPAAVEKRAHKLLTLHRVNPQREYFTVSIAQAVAAIRQASIEVAGIESWDTVQPVVLNNGDRVALTLRAGQWLVVLPNGYEPNPAVPVDIWQAHVDGDLLELMATNLAGSAEGLSVNDDNGIEDPVPYLNRQNSSYNLPIIGRERLEPGQRLLWLDGAIDRPNCVMAMFECASHCQVVCRTVEPKLSPQGNPILLNTVTDEPTERMIHVVHAAMRMRPSGFGVPPAFARVLPRYEGEPHPPSFWLPQLGVQPRRPQIPRNS